MATRQELTTNQVKDHSLNKDDIDISTPGKALITQIVPGYGISFDESTGIDSGTGVVTISSYSYGSRLVQPTLNNSGNGIVLNINVNSNSVGFGACLAIDSSTDLLVEASALNEDRIPAIALALQTGTGMKDVLLQGIIRKDSWNWDPNKTIYVSTTTGLMTQIRPNGLNQIVQELGFALTSKIIIFNPDKSYFKLLS